MEQIIECFAPTNQMGLPVHHQDLRRSEPGIVIRGHRKTVGPGSEKGQDVPFAYRGNLAIDPEGFGFADVAPYGVDAGLARGSGQVDDWVLAILEHGADQVVEARIHTGKDGGVGSRDVTYPV